MNTIVSSSLRLFQHPKNSGQCNQIFYRFFNVKQKSLHVRTTLFMQTTWKIIFATSSWEVGRKIVYAESKSCHRIYRYKNAYPVFALK